MPMLLLYHGEGVSEHEPVTMQIEDLAKRLKVAESVVVVTGAGVSAESGIPTFRDALDGLWEKFAAEDLATPQAFARDPELVSKWYDDRRQNVLKCNPNPGHYALAAMQEHMVSVGKQFTIITQNVDGLHARAGANDVIEIHGSLIRWRCTKTGEYAELPVPLPEYPMPSAAGGLMRPGVVWFGEPMPASPMDRSIEALSLCDVYIAIGTSGMVYPVAGFVELAATSGATTIEMNLSQTALDFDAFVLGRSGEVLPALAEAWFGYEAQSK